MREAAHILVSGIVQGVGYRYWTERNARELGLAGWVRNLDDGRVEMLVEGEQAAVEAMIQRCWKGPRSAHVEGVDVTRAKLGAPTEFRVRRDGDAPETPQTPETPESA